MLNSPLKIGIVVLLVIVGLSLQALDIQLLSLEGLVIIGFTCWFIISTLEQRIASEAAALKSEIEEHLDDRLNKTIESLEEKFSAMIDPTVERIGELVWMYKKDNPNHEEEEIDELYESARVLVDQPEKAKASYLQKELDIGYARAMRLLDLLEEREGIKPSE